MASIYLNDTAIEDLGLVLTDGGPDIAGLSIARDRQAWQGRAGSLPANNGTVDSRVLRFTVQKRLTTYAERSAFMDQMADILTGAIEVRFGDQSARAIRGTARVFDGHVIAKPRFVNMDAEVIVEIECFTAAKWSVEPQSRVIGSAAVPDMEIPVGTLPHGGQIYIAGSNSTQQTIKYRSIKGTLLGNIIFTPALATGEYAMLDLDNESITKYTTAGVASNESRWIDPSSVWFKVYPRDCDRANSAWPTINASTIMYYIFRNNWAT
jgi:hypothetical protein